MVSQNFCKIIASVKKTNFQKLKPKIVHYRDYTRFFNKSYRQNLQQNLSLANINTNSKVLGRFLQICNNTPHETSPRKKKYLSGNNIPFLVKNYLRRAKNQCP